MDHAQSHHKLQPHPAALPDKVVGVTCSVVQNAANWALDFQADAPPGALLLPKTQTPARTDGLWRTTCFEFFLKREREAGYFEFNLSPSGQWAAYRFEGYRQGGADLEMEAPSIRCSPTPTGFRLQAALTILAGPCRAGFSAVIEETGGTKSYWALAHPSEKPDFHHPDSFVLELP